MKRYLAVVVVAALWLAGCSAEQRAQLSALKTTYDRTAEVAGTKNVNVTVHNGVTMTIAIPNTKWNSAVEAEREAFARRVASVAFTTLNDQKVTSVHVVFLKATNLGVVRSSSVITQYRFSSDELAPRAASDAT